MDNRTISLTEEEKNMSTQELIRRRHEVLRFTFNTTCSPIEAEGAKQAMDNLDLIAQHLSFPRPTGNANQKISPQTRMEAMHFFELLTHAKHAMGSVTSLDNAVLSMAELIANDFNHEYRSSMKIEPMV